MAYFVCLFLFFCPLPASSRLIRNHLKVGMVNLDPFCTQDAQGKERGFLVDLFKELLDRVNHSGTQSVTYETYWVSSENSTNESEIWTAVREDLLNGEADIILAPLADTSGWNGLVQLSQPYMLAPFLPLVVSTSQTRSKKEYESTLDLTRQGKLRPVYVTGSAIDALIQRENRTPGKILREMEKGSLVKVTSYEEAVSRMRTLPEDYVVFGEELRLRHVLAESTNCDLSFDWKSIFGIGAYVLPISLYVKDQALLCSINNNLLAMRQDGTIERLVETWWSAASIGECRVPVRNDIMNALHYY